MNSSLLETNGAAPQTLQSPPVRTVLVDAASGRKPATVARLSDWEYLERCTHRLLCAWGRTLADWDDKVALHRHVWESAEIVRRLRDRLVQFPGTTGNLDAPVCAQLETLAQTVLDAPSGDDAVDGIYQIWNGALVGSYLAYAQSAHPVHDAPTVALLHEILGVKEAQRLWLRDHRRRHPHTTDADYRARIERELEGCGHLRAALAVERGNCAEPVGVRGDFRLPAQPKRPASWRPRHDFGPFVETDFASSIETRRLFWCYGYLLELGLAEDMLRWIWDGHWMPWEWQHAVSRHLWDESRHGDSGHSRLLDFGISIEEIGFPAAPESFEFSLQNKAQPMTPAELYEQAFFIGMVAETGHFAVKNEAYEDFKAGGDLESAEMMIFDIIDEGAHVRYFHEWHDELARRAGVEADDYRQRAARERQKRQLEQNTAMRECAAHPREGADFAFYQELLERMRAKVPLSNAATCPVRSDKPM